MKAPMQWYAFAANVDFWLICQDEKADIRVRSRKVQAKP